jgi:threonine synthase
LNYQSTRGGRASVPSAQAIAQGICRDGGLFVPESFPVLARGEFEAMERESYAERADRILSLFLTDFTPREIGECTEKAYDPELFSGGRPAPLARLEGTPVSFLELWHGPTCAFKDMALRLLPHLMTKSLGKIHAENGALILVATSGDTGKAALEGFRDVKGTRILVFYPQDGVSPMQQRQMCTQEGSNVSVCAVRGNFDDAQTGVKRMFADAELQSRLAERGWMFSSANSINWGRLVPQIVYYFSAYCDLVSAGRARFGEKINVTVPTGNFGNILAAYYAMKMGLPVNRLICASNANNVLTEFLTTGVYDRNRRFYTTLSPSMDILVSSNLERLLYDLTGGDGERVAGWMLQLARTGRYEVDADIKEKIRGIFYASCCGDSETREEIRRVYETGDYLCDPHTAVASHAFRRYAEETGDGAAPSVVVSTASPYKFAPGVLYALTGMESGGESEFEAVERLSRMTGAPVPGPIESLRSKPVRFQGSCGADGMGKTVLEFAEMKD